MADSKLRSFIKTFTWRFIATLTTFIIALAVFHDTDEALKKATTVASIEVVSKLVLYYFHERAWAHITAVNGDIKKSD